MVPSEDPFDVWRRRAGIPPDLFADFEKEFARMQGMVNRIMEDALKHASGPRREQPFVYGFSMRIGKDGLPQLTPFGSAQPFAPTVEGGEEVREPLTDVLETDKEVSVTIELPGVEKEHVNLHVADEVVTIKVEKGRHRYHKAIRLPCKVLPGSARATFKNGILDVTIKRRDERHDPGQHVAID